MDTTAKRGVSSRTQELVRGVAWFLADSIAYARFAACSSAVRVCALELAPRKKADFCRRIVRGSVNYSVLPNGYLHGKSFKVHSPMLYAVNHHGVYVGRVIWNNLIVAYDFCRPETRIIGRLRIVVSENEVRVKRYGNNTRLVKCYRCRHCKTFHSFVAHVPGRGSFSLVRHCLSRTYVKMVVGSGSNIWTRMLSSQAIVQAVIAYAKSLKTRG